MKDIASLSVRQYRIFRPDLIPFNAMRSATGREFLNKLFGFATFGEDATVGDIAFQNGHSLAGEPQQAIPIRVLQINERRLIVEVAGSSDDAKSVYEQVMQAIQGYSGKQGLLELEPVAFTEETSCVVTLESDLSRLMPPAITASLEERLREASAPEGTRAEVSGIAFSVSLRFFDHDPRFRNAGITLAEKRLSLETRVNTAFSDRVFFVISPTDSETHLRLIEALDDPTAA